jgi:hypothetical protein
LNAEPTAIPRGSLCTLPAIRSPSLANAPIFSASQAAVDVLPPELGERLLVVLGAVGAIGMLG